MNISDIVVDGLPEMQLGTSPLKFKIVFDPRKYKNCHDISMSVLDSSGIEVPIEISRWGTKMRATVTFSNENSEGRARVIVTSKEVSLEVTRFWFVR